jgi:hypothetical protein
VIGFLRILGVANAAVWFGAAIFFTFAVGPAFFSDRMLNLLGRPHAGAAAQLVLERYFLLHQICGGVALVHVVAEWLYMGKPLQRLTLWLLIGIYSLGLIGGYGLQPKLQGLHRTIYGPGATTEQRQQARRSFNTFHGLSQFLNLVVMAGVALYLWRVTAPGNGYRYRA